MNKGILQYGKLKHSWNRLIYIVIIFYLYISVFGRKTKIDRTDIQYTLFCININVYTNIEYCINGKTC